MPPHEAAAEDEMSASLVYHFGSIAPGETASVFIHGYTDKQAVSYSAIVYGQYPAPYPSDEPAGTRPGSLRAGRVTLSQGETFRWAVDGTIARKVYVQNHEDAPVGVYILQIVEEVRSVFRATISDSTTAKK
jgi:hypothetical protein